MKKIIMALTAALFVATSASAFSLTGGLAYGRSIVTKLNDDLTVDTEASQTEEEDKIGLNVGLFNVFGDGPFGWFTDVQALWPVHTVSKNDAGDYTFTPTKSFNINAVLGPALSFNLNDVTQLHLGAGIDLNYNTKEYEQEGLAGVKAVITDQTFNWGPAIKADLNFLLLGFIGVGVSCDVGFLWGQTTLDTDLKSGKVNVDNVHNDSYKNFTLLFVPSVNAVIKLGK